MIVMKFGGTSLADAERIREAAEIVRDRVPHKPLVVVSALGGVTDLLEQAIDVARAADRDALDPLLADLERRHRWALTGTVEESGRRHQLSLDLDRAFENLRQRLRSIRILGEATARARDAVLACGESLSARLVVAAFADRGLPARWVDARRVMITDDRFGEAEPDLVRAGAAARDEMGPRLERGEIPVLGGFVGSTQEGDSTTLGRGGSDTSAAVLGLLLQAEEIQIWTDVDGLMSADPRRVPGARCLEQVTFAEAAELAHFGARVLHPPSLAPALRRQIPVRVLNARAPQRPGTRIVPEDSAGLVAERVAVASRSGYCLVRVREPRLRRDPDFLPSILRACAEHQSLPDLLLFSEVTVGLALPEGPRVAGLVSVLSERAEVERCDGRALISVVGSGLVSSSGLRRRVLAELANWGPELVAVGTSGTSISAVLEEVRLEPALLELHRRFFEEREAR